MAKIFLSYRREDSAEVAGRIYDRLRVPTSRHVNVFDAMDEEPQRDCGNLIQIAQNH
jgi:hypothetical protein